MNKKFIIALTVFIDVLGIGIIIPILPFYVESFGATAMTVTLLFAVFSFCAFFSAPFLGVLSDKIGRRPVLIASIASTAIGWIVFAMAPNVIWLFVGRIIDGIAAGNFPIAQSYLVDIAKDDKEKTTNLGLIGAIFGVGLITGPLIGGALSSISMVVPFYFVAGLALFNMILAIIQLPETNKHIVKHQKLVFQPFLPIIKAMQNSRLRIGFLVWFLFSLALATQQSIFSLYLSDAFGLESFAISLIMGGMGVVLVINQGLAMKKIWLRYFNENNLVLMFTALISLAMILLGINILAVLFFGLFVYAVSQSVLRVVITSQISKKADPKEQGMIMGVLSSIMSIGMVVGPIVAGFLYLRNISFPFWLSSIFLVVAFLLYLYDYKRNEAVIAKEVSQ